MSIERLRERFHREESGAVVILVLAMCVILLMLSWMMYDAGEMSRSKLKTQASADAAAYSHAAKRAESMNLIVYANIAKTILFSYIGTYFGAYQALRETQDYYRRMCFTTDPPAPELLELDEFACEGWLIASHQLISQNFEAKYQHEIRELWNDGSGIGGWRRDVVFVGEGGGIKALDDFQRDVVRRTPMLAWVEAATQARTNGADFGVTWPNPEFGPRTGTDFRGVIPRADVPHGMRQSITDVVDYLPVERFPATGDTEWRDNLSGCSTRWSMPGGYDTSPGRANAVSRDPYMRGAITCNPDAARAFGGESALPYVFREETYVPSTGLSDEWLHHSSSFAFAFNDVGMNADLRKKYDIWKPEYKFKYASDEELFRKPNGMWAMARAELVYGSGPQPSMAECRWGARMRPLAHDDEWGPYETIDGDSIGLNAMYHDTVGYMLLAGPDFGSVSHRSDLLALERLTAGFDTPWARKELGK